MKIKKHLWAIIYSVFLVGFTVYIALDTFVISTVYQVVEETKDSTTYSDDEETIAESNQASSEDATASDDTSETDNSETSETTTDETSADSSATETTITENSYQDENISITITEYYEYDTAIYVADIELSSAEYLQTALAKSSYGKNVTEKTSEIASDVGAILAINGDYYGAQESGYVIRNGVIYRSTGSSGQEDLAIYSDGNFEIISEDEISAEELLANGVVQTLSFGPALVVDGAVAVSSGEEVGKAKASNPRTAIGIIDDLHYVFVVSDGRTDESAGLSLSELAEFMQGLGVQTAYNLDGGGSSTMYFNGEVVNNPTSDGKKIKERSVSDIVYIGY